MTIGDRGKRIHISTLRILYFGMSGFLSRIPLAKLLAAKVTICGLVLPTSVLPPYLHPPNGRFQTITPQANQSILLTPHPDMLQLAAQEQIPVTAVSTLLHPDVLKEIATLHPDLILVSCFDQKFPKALLNIPRYGCLNLHPSLLPQLRGPAPLFWAAQQGLQNTGVTLHFMDEKLDTGDICLQSKYTLPDGLSGNETEIQLATIGADLMLTALSQITTDKVTRQPQTGNASYFPAPTGDDFRLQLKWSARRAFNFMRGTAEWKRPYPIQINEEEEIKVHTAVSYHPQRTQAHPLQQQNNYLSIQFSDGILIATPITTK